MNTAPRIFRLFLYAGVVTILSLFSSCERNKVENYLRLGTDSVAYSNTGMFLSITSAEKWDISLHFPDEYSGTAWCSVSPASGTGNKNNIALTYLKNEGYNPREVIIRVDFKKEFIEKRFVQGGYESQGGGEGGGDHPSEMTSDRVNEWLELPLVTIGENQAYISHYVTIGNKKVRNYSMLYDGANKIALWVAYPLCSFYMGSQGRTDAWNYDPKIPVANQPMLFSGFPSMAGISGCERGASLPSADRTANYSTNAATFYFTNMTPQNSSLNQGVWAKLETKVRGYSSSTDTLYVVTGPVLATTSDPVITHLNQKGTSNILTTLPKAYFKVLLKYNVSSTSFSSIAFWYENKSYGYDDISIADVQTVKEIERRTGLTFFKNLPLTEAQITNLKNEFNPSSWGI